MAYTPQQIMDLVSQGKGPKGMYSGSDQSGQLSKQHDEIADDMLQLQGAMQGHWQGDAAGQAYAGAGPMVQASQVSGEHLTQAQGLYTGQGSSFKDLHGKVAAVGPLGDKPKDDWVSDTPVSFLSNRSNEIDAWNQKAQQVVEGYNTYHGQSTDNSGRWTAPSQYGELGLPPSGADIKPTSPGSEQPATGFGSEQQSTAGYRGGAVGHPGGVSGSSDPGRAGGVDGGVPQQGGHPGNYVSPPGTVTPSSPSHSGPSQSGGTTAAGYLPSTTAGGAGDYGTTGGYGNTGFGPGGPGTGGFGPGSGSAGGFLPSGGGFGPGGSGSAAGTGSGAGGFGAGKGSGAGVLGGELGAGSRVSGSAGGPGRPSAPGMGAGGGMGRGGNGEGAEDSEHKTADYLLERDPDDALVGKLPKATPPVIGL